MTTPRQIRVHQVHSTVDKLAQTLRRGPLKWSSPVCCALKQRQVRGPLRREPGRAVHARVPYRCEISAALKTIECAVGGCESSSAAECDAQTQSMASGESGLRWASAARRVDAHYDS